MQRHKFLGEAAEAPEIIDFRDLCVNKSNTRDI